MMSERMLLGFAAALGSGLLIGIERVRRKGRGPHRAFAGVRTFSLAAVAGAGARSTGQDILVIAGAALIVVLAGISYWRDRSKDPGVTTEMALFVTYILGVVAMGEPALAAGGAVVVTTLLASRSSLHRFSVDVLSETELRYGLLFCGAALVLLPLLPVQGTPWLAGVSPRRLWSLVVLFMGLQAAGYSALRAAGPRLGLALSGPASGFVSSTATIATLGARARQDPALLNACVSGALFSTIATVVLLAIVAAAVDFESLRLLTPSLLAGAAAAVTGAAVGLHYQSGTAAAATSKGRAFNIAYARGFALILSGFTAIMSYAAGRFGELAVRVSAALAGFFDVHAAATSVLSLASKGTVPRAKLVTAVLLAFSSNTISKLS